METMSGGRVRAGAAVLAINAATRGVGLCAAGSVASSHIVLTEPVPEVLEELGWAGGEASPTRAPSRTTCAPRADGRIAFGWGGGRLRRGRPGQRPDVEVDPRSRPRPTRTSSSCPRSSRGAPSPTPGAVRSTSPPGTSRRSGPWTTARCTTRSASPATASARRTWPAARSPRSRAASRSDLGGHRPEPGQRPGRAASPSLGGSIRPPGPSCARSARRRPVSAWTGLQRRRGGGRPARARHSRGPLAFRPRVKIAVVAGAVAAVGDSRCSASFRAGGKRGPVRVSVF